MSDCWRFGPEEWKFSGEKFQKVNLFETQRMFCDFYCFEPGQEQKVHTHAESDKIYYVVEGEGIFQVGEEERKLGPGYAVWAPPVHREDVSGRLNDTDYLLIQDDAPDSIASAVPLNTLSVIPSRNIEVCAERVIHVPWCAPLSSTLEQMRSSVVSLAAVVNEYGETIGVLSYEDVVDTILAPLPSRAKRVLRREPVLEVAPGRFHVDGLTTLRYLTQRLGVHYEPTHDGPITVSGLLHELLERLPAVGDECVWHDWRIKVIDVLDRGKVRVMIAPIASASEQQIENP